MLMAAAERLTLLPPFCVWRDLSFGTGRSEAHTGEFLSHEIHVVSDGLVEHLGIDLGSPDVGVT